MNDSDYSVERRLHNYDWTKSTAENYQCSDCNFIGEFKHLRKSLDHNFHVRYNFERQLFQDRVVNYYIGLKSAWNRPAWNNASKYRATVMKQQDPEQARMPSNLRDPQNPPFVLFTAGAMGAGKSHTLRWLAETTEFPLQAAVFVDIDRIREHFPEMDEYRRRWAPTCGTLTHKEAGYISELIWSAALENGQDVIIDSSLRDLSWWTSVINDVRRNHSSYSIGLLQVVADTMTIFQRQHQRAQSTGRMVPFSTMMDSIRQTPISVSALRPRVNFFLRYDLNGRSPKLLVRETQGKENVHVSKL